MASADEMAPAMTAVRVVRRLTVRAGPRRGIAGRARERLAAPDCAPMWSRGRPDRRHPPRRQVGVRDRGPAGSTVDSGTTVEVTVAKVC